MIPKNQKNNTKNFQKLNYICYDKIKSIPKQNYIPSQNFNKSNDLYNYNNSLDAGSKLFKKIKKTNKKSLRNKPLLSERIRNLSKKGKKDIQLGSISIEKSDIFNINQTENHNNTLNQKKIFDYYNNEPLFSISPSSNNIYDQNIIINNNNYDKKIIFYREKNDYNTDENININDIYSYNMLQNNYVNNKNDEYYFKRNNNNQNLGKNNYNSGLHLSEFSNNNIKFKSMKNLNKLKKLSVIEDNINVKTELDKFLMENFNRKIKINSSQKNQENNEDIIKQREKKKFNLKKRKGLPSKKSWDLSYNNTNKENFDQENYNSKTAERKNIVNKKNHNQMNTILDSMQFKIKKRKLSLNYNNVNKIINFNNSIDINNQSTNNKKLSLMNNSYNKVYNNDGENEKYFEELNDEEEDEDEENKIKEDSIDMNQIGDLKTSKKSINVIESNQLQEKISIIKEESDK